MSDAWKAQGESRWDSFLSKPWDVPTEPDIVQAACRVLPVTGTALSISCASEIRGKA